MPNLFDDFHFFNELNSNDIQFKNGKANMKYNHNKPGICVIYRDTCPHCVHMRETFKNLENNIDIDKYFISGINTNNPNTREITGQLNIQYVPKTYLVRPNGDLLEFSGDGHSHIELGHALQTIALNMVKETPKIKRKISDTSHKGNKRSKKKSKKRSKKKSKKTSKKKSKKLQKRSKTFKKKKRSKK